MINRTESYAKAENLTRRAFYQSIFFEILKVPINLISKTPSFYLLFAQSTAPAINNPAPMGLMADAVNAIAAPTVPSVAIPAMSIKWFTFLSSIMITFPL
jgi:hypothetical protein